METQNEQKAKEIAQYHCASELNLLQAYNSALDMAEWKDEQYKKEKETFFKEYRKELVESFKYDYEQKLKKEKQLLIDKACKWLEKYLFYLDKKDDVINNFKQSMKGK